MTFNISFVFLQIFFLNLGALLLSNHSRMNANGTQGQIQSFVFRVKTKIPGPHFIVEFKALLALSIMSFF